MRGDGGFQETQLQSKTTGPSDGHGSQHSWSITVPESLGVEEAFSAALSPSGLPVIAEYLDEGTGHQGKDEGGGSLLTAPPVTETDEQSASGSP